MIRRLCRACLIWLRTDYSWDAARDLAQDVGPYCIRAKRDGLLYIEPR